MANGYEGWGNIREGAGWADTAGTQEGFYLKLKELTVDSGQEFIENDDLIVNGRGYKSSTRIKGASKPGVTFNYQARSDDFPMIAMSHFQMFTGTVESGTAEYTFVPSKCSPKFVTGGVYGTGGYTSESGTLFTLEFTNKLNCETSGNGQSVQGLFCDELTFNAELNESLMVNAVMKGKDFDEVDLNAATDPDNSTYGSYSTKAAFSHFSGTLSFAGQTGYTVSSFSWTSSNQSEERIGIGSINPVKYSWGKSQVTGEIAMDLPDDATLQLGSMLSDTEFAITGTWYNSAHDRITISIPRAKRNPFAISHASGEEVQVQTIPFRAFESEDGDTAPISVVVTTTGIGSAFEPV